MLTRTLRSLARDGLIPRTVTPTVPVTVPHGLIDLGRRAAYDGASAWTERGSPAPRGR
ncbi:winged helix-turn-helix transcriptional regulator [Geodermatophilus marinus]|uniref:winged helix-turn-helix transcriptional regulator n=1 Tax=Geodermatophilus sp. LHW52908 TaxID=2303986 RepID=UPI0018F5786E|nr:winged helix-turn-helix transcriptional regulator [Geodermatophilus sp. LHW52908]